MLDIIVTRRNVHCCGVRPYWGDGEKVMEAVMTWDRERIDEVIMYEHNLVSAGLTAPSFGVGLVQKVSFDIWFSLVGRVETVYQLAKAPMRLGERRSEEFDFFTRWYYMAVLGDISEWGTHWELHPCGDHIHLVEVSNTGGSIVSLDLTKYGRTIENSLPADEQAGLAEVELENAEADWKDDGTIYHTLSDEDIAWYEGFLR